MRSPRIGITAAKESIAGGPDGVPIREEGIASSLQDERVVFAGYHGCRSIKDDIYKPKGVRARRKDGAWSYSRRNNIFGHCRIARTTINPSYLDR